MTDVANLVVDIFRCIELSFQTSCQQDNGLMCIEQFSSVCSISRCKFHFFIAVDNHTFLIIFSLQFAIQTLENETRQEIE